jgi:sulfur-oxidizing protein SoxY
MRIEDASLRARSRRGFVARGGALAALLLTGLLRPLAALAQEWNKAAFETRDVQEAMRAAGVRDLIESQDILIRAPEIAENGAQVPIEIESRIPGTQTISIFVDKNVQPYVGTFAFREGAEPFISTRIKMGDTSPLRVIVRAGDKQYAAVREVKVTIGGCGT